MTAAEKIVRILQERRLKQADVIRSAIAAGHGEMHSGSLSKALGGKEQLTLRNVIPIANVLDISLDWLFDEKAGFPAPKKSERGVILTETERTLLSLARRVCKFDADPEALDRALDLLTRGQLPSVESDPKGSVPRSHETYGQATKRKKAGGQH